MAYHGKSKQINHRTKKLILEKIKRDKFSPPHPVIEKLFKEFRLNKPLIPFQKPYKFIKHLYPARDRKIQRMKNTTKQAQHQVRWWRVRQKKEEEEEMKQKISWSTF